MTVNIIELKKIIESSSDIGEAARKANMTRQGVYWHLDKNNLAVTKRLKVVKKSKTEK